jgi:hypothetical protein
MMLAAIALAANLTHYDCAMEVPKALDRGAQGVSLHEIAIPGMSEGDWRFALALDKGKGGRGVDATITWQRDPIQVAGKHAALVTADGSIAFSAFSTGPCTFTESMCMTLVSMARQPDDSVKFVMLPSALASDPDAKKRAPFVVVAEGSCKEVAQ